MNVKVLAGFLCCCLLASSAFSVAVGNLALRLANASHRALPSFANGSTVSVYVGFYVESMGNFKPTEMAFDLDMYLRLSWTDQRLAHNEKKLLVVTDLAALNDVWLPDLYFANARAANFQHVTIPNFSIFIHPDGTVALSRRVTMNVACNMNLRRYPLDLQNCFIKVGSYAHIKSQMNVQWFSKNAIDFNQNIDLPELSLTSITPRYCDGLFEYAKTEYDAQQAHFSCLLAEISLHRSATYHLVQSYIPTFLIVVISWISFWIDRNAVPARVSLSFTTLLTLSTMVLSGTQQGAGLRYSLPPVSYAKAIDYWYGVCMLFVFGALLEFAVVNNFMRRAQKCAKLAETGSASGKTGSFMAEIAEFGMDTTTDPRLSSEATSNGGLASSTVPTPLPQCRRSVPPPINSVERERWMSVKSLLADRALKAGNTSARPLLFESRIVRSLSTTIPPDGLQYHQFQQLLEALRARGDYYSRKALRVDQGCRLVFPLTFAAFSTFYWSYYLLLH